jgi:hypothetical protein
MLYFLCFYGCENRGLASTALVHGIKEMCLHSVADRMLVLPKQGRYLRSEIILIVFFGVDGGESGFCRDTVNCRKDTVHDNIDAA